MIETKMIASLPKISAVISPILLLTIVKHRVLNSKIVERDNPTFFCNSRTSLAFESPFLAMLCSFALETAVTDVSAEDKREAKTTRHKSTRNTIANTIYFSSINLSIPTLLPTSIGIVSVGSK